MASNQVETLRDLLVAAHIDHGRVFVGIGLARAVLNSDWLTKVRAEAWDEGCEHDIATCRAGCAYNPYRTTEG